MSVVVTSRVRRAGLRGWMRYVCGLDGERRAAWLSDLGGPAETVAAVEGFLRGTSRKNAGLSVVQSFRISELDPGDPAAVSTAVETTYSLMRRINPESPAVAVAHVDSASGFLHVHGLLVNHNLSTGRAADSSRWQHWTVRRENDELMRELGLEVVRQSEIAPEPKWSRTISEDERLTVDDALDRASVRAYLRQEIDAAILADGVETVDDVIAAAAARGVEIKIIEGDRGRYLDAAAVDVSGAVIRNATTSKKGKTRRIKIAATGTKLGVAYTPDGIAARLEAARVHQAQMENQKSEPERDPRHRALLDWIHAEPQQPQSQSQQSQRYYDD